MNQFADYQQGYPQQPPKKGSNALWWILGGMGAMFLLCCGGGLGFVMYIGTVGPETSVYTGNNVPSRFVKVMKDEGALDDDETLLYFYSDGLTDIRDGFYFVSDKKVVVYTQGTGATPLTAMPFDQIESAELFRNESFLEDSQIIIFLKDGTPVSFPVSSEFDRDQKFFDEIQSRIKQ